MAKYFDMLLSTHCNLQDVSSEEMKWLWEVKETSPFMDWLTRYIDDSNCVNNRHLHKYVDWCEDGEELCSKDLDQALEEHGIEVHKYLFSDLSHFELELLDRELEVLKTHDNLALELEFLLSDKIQKSITNEEALEVKLKTSQEACQKEGQNLMKINVPLKANMTHLFGNILKLISTLKDVEDPDVKNRFLSNMPLENTINVCEKFNEYANLCLKRKFEQPLYNEKHTVAELMPFLDQETCMRSRSSSSNDLASGLPKNLWKMNINRISMHGTLCGYTAAMHYLTKLKENALFEKYNYLQIKMEVATLQDEILRLSDDLKLILKHEVANLAEDDVLCIIFSVVEEITNRRIERRQLMLRKLCSVTTVIDNFLCLTDLLWMLLIKENGLFKFCTDLLKETSDFCTSELTKHKEIMNGLNNISNDYNLCTDSQRSGQALFMGIVQRLLDITADHSNSGSCTSSENQSKELEYIQVSDVLKPFEKQLVCQEQSIYELLSELTDGPTRKPQLVKREVALAMQEVENQLKNCNADLEDIAKTFSCKQLAFKKSPVSKNRRLLWVWFLVAPDQLEKALKLAETLKMKK